MKIRYGILLTAACLLTACASPEIEETAPVNQVTETMSESEQAQLEADNGTHISRMIEAQNGNIAIDADVEICSGQFYKGNVDVAFPSGEIIADMFADGQELEKREDINNGVLEEWTLYPEQPGEAAFILAYSIGTDGARYQNTSVQAFNNDYTGLERISEDDFTEDEQALYDNLRKEAEAVLQELGVVSREFPGSMERVGDKYLAYVNTISTLEGVPAVSGNYYSFVKNQVCLSDQGIEDMQFGGSLSAEDTSPVQVLSLDEILSVFEEKLADGDIFMDTSLVIEKIGLYYCINYDEGTFFPVWCMCGRLGNDAETMLPYVYLDAVNGALIEWEMGE